MNDSSKKRLIDDRRAQEIGPPDGWRERRRAVERRLPEVRELAFSEWLAQFRGYLAKSDQESYRQD